MSFPPGITAEHQLNCQEPVTQWLGQGERRSREGGGEGGGAGGQRGRLAGGLTVQ